MYGTILSVLLMGMVPVTDVSAGETALRTLTVASPSPLADSALARTGANPGLSASGMVMLDLQSAQEVYARNPALRRPMGSLTKLMTALIIVENHALDEAVKVPGDISRVEGSSASLPGGGTFTVGDLLSALLMASANDAARTLAEHHSGTEEAFVTVMNARAKALGLRDTSFTNAAGFDDARHWSTPRDIAWLALHVMRYPAIRERMALRETIIRGADGREISISHTHTLLHQDAAIVAGKTGTTPAARECLLSVVREGDREYVVVLLGSRGRYADMRSLLAVLRRFFA